jgi:3-oxoacyl-[acyl-carrier protein] reductase
LRLKDKTAIVTGGGNGIGKETILTFVREGANVVIVDFDVEAGNQTLKEVKALGGNGIFQRVDVSDRQNVNEMVKVTLDTFGRIDILVNNAGITADSMLLKLTEDNWKKVLDVNLTGVFNCTQAVVGTMIEQGSGKIISASSVVGVYGNVGQTNYAASKAGVIGMTKTWAKEFGKKGICVNAVAPGFVKTNMVEKVPEKVLTKMVKKVPLARLGKPSDIANAYLFLSSEESNYINGTVLQVDGGIVI